ncbi:hypothetical protein EMPS_11049 [Entomortierella parvispora]|uniref:F-box domain-containing protein n=1 Tax=Entomortierella parvispora TaxID=205924 RepID=A0A9P3HKZ5_9FUNG|nr:hypothetical protein EMPS_11049 [Entomortierella parvispora]
MTLSLQPHAASPRHDAVLIPELAYQIQLQLNQRDLSLASQVCRAWHEAWAPFLYYAVQYRGGQQSSMLQQQAHFQGTTKDPPQSHRSTYSGSVHHHQPHHMHLRHPHQETRQPWVPSFIDFKKYGHWIKSIEASNLFVFQGTDATPRRTGAVRTGDESPFSVQDHLSQIQTCNSLSLTRLEITKTVLSLERLDRLLSALPTLKSFHFEVMNKPELASGSTHGSTSSRISNGAHSTSPSRRTLLSRTQQIGLQGLEPEVVRLIARRLCMGLETLGLAFELPSRISLPAFEELFDRCGSTLKSLSLTKVEICERNYEENVAFSVATVDFLSGLLESTSLSPSLPTPPSSSSSSTIIPASSSSSLYSMASSSTSLFPMSPRSLYSIFSNSPSEQIALESLTMNFCAVPDRTCEWVLKRAPELLELHIHDSRHVGPGIVGSILRYSPLLESLSLSSAPNIGRQSLARLFERLDKSTDMLSATSSGPSNSLSTATAAVGAASSATAQDQYPGLRLKKIRLAYLRGLDNSVMTTLATHQGSTLQRLSVQWCPDITDEGIVPIFRHCSQLQELSLSLSKLTPDIFKDSGDELMNNHGPSEWACQKTLERLEIGGQMFLHRLQLSNLYLQPQLYHHLSPNPHRHARTASQSFTRNMSWSPRYNRSISSLSSFRDIGIINNNGSGQSNVLQDTYSLAHHEGYPMYHLHQRYDEIGDPFGSLKTRLASLPRLYHLGVSTKGVEHLIRKGFGPHSPIQSLALLGQQGRKWTLEEVKDLLEHMPRLRKLYCEKETILSAKAELMQGPPKSPSFSIPVNLHEQKLAQDMVELLRKHRVEVVQSAMVQAA